MNEFLYRYNSIKFSSPLCSCEKEEQQNSVHVLTVCGKVNINHRNEMNQFLENNPLHNLANYGTNSLLISWNSMI